MTQDTASAALKDEPVTRVELLKVSLEFPGPWAVGAAAGWGDADLPILADPRGEEPTPYLPSTSLVGSLREHLGRDAVRWLGPDAGEGTRTPSAVWALGTRWQQLAKVEDATTTAIDGARAAAAPGSLRTAQRAAPPTNEPCRVDWYLQSDVPAEDLVNHLLTWRPWVGRSRSTGMGECRVIEVERVPLDLRDASQLTWWLTGRHDWLSGRGAAPWARTRSVDPTEPGWEWLIPFQVVDALAVGTGDRTGAGVANGTRQATSRAVRTSGSSPIVPGTAWKGIFRHRTELVLRAVGLTDAELARVVGYLYGPPPGQETRAGRGVLRFFDSRVTSPDGGQAQTTSRMHVAIDRVSGGAADRLLYAVTSVDAGSLLTLRVAADAEPPAALRDLLSWVVKDLTDGLVGVGGLTRSGHGTVALTDPTWLDGLGPLDRQTLNADAPGEDHSQAPT